jgi:recombination protein RecA
MARKTAQPPQLIPSGPPPVDDARKAILDKAVGDIVKRYGEGSIMRMGEAHHMAVEAIPTGSLSLDLALGVGGIPRGRVIEIYGPESSGKTTLCQHIVAESQKKGGMAAYIDMEHALDPRYAANCGVDIVNLLISQPDTGEQALEICETLVRSSAIDVVVVD